MGAWALTRSGARDRRLQPMFPSALRRALTRISFLRRIRCVKRQSQKGLRYWADFEGDALLTADLHELRMLDQRESVSSVNTEGREDSSNLPVTYALRTQQNRVVQVLVCTRPVS